MKGLGASTRLWEIIDRIPTIPITSELKLCLNFELFYLLVISANKKKKLILDVDVLPLDGVVPSVPVSGSINFQSLTFRYPLRPDVTIFNDFNLHVLPGSITALVGSSGSGKSTLANLLLRFYDPESGGCL